MTSFSALNLRPGVQFRVTQTDVLPTPLTNHAIAYLFVSVPGSSWDSSPEDYSELAPLTPTIVTSLADYLEKIGGTIPSPITDYPAFISYQSVDKFFQSSSGAGVLYVIRTVITPQVRITLDPVNSVNSTNFVIKIDGVYYGTVDLGIQDAEGVQVFALETTGIDIADNTFDIKAFLEANSFFASNYEIDNNPVLLNAGSLVISSKSFGTVPDISVFQTPDSTLLLSNLIDAGTVTPLTNKRELNFRLNTAETVNEVDGLSFYTNYYAALQGATDTNPGEFVYEAGSAEVTDPVELSLAINALLIANNVYPENGAAIGNVDLTGLTVADQYVAITLNDGVVFPTITETAGANAVRTGASVPAYYQASEGVGGVISWSIVTIPTLTPVSVQSYALNVDDPTNRFIITSNGATALEHQGVFTPKLVTAVDDSQYVITPKDGQGDNPALVSLGWETISGTNVTADATTPQRLAGGLYTWDVVFSYEIESLISVPKYIWNGTNSQGNTEANFFSVLDDSLGLLATYATPRVQDYVNAIQNGVSDVGLLPGFVLCPEAYGRYSSVVDTDTSLELRNKRLAITSALVQVASTRDWFALVDDSADALNSQQSSQEFNSIVAAIPSAGGYFGFYYPQVLDFDSRVVPASAYVAGIALNRYSTEGFREPPAGINYPLVGALRPKYVVNESQLEINSIRGMNAIVSIPNSGVVVFGARTTATATPVQFVNSRIIANVALQSLRNSFDGFIFNALQTNNQTVFDSITTTAVGILQDLYDAGALIGATPNDAYIVVCDSRNNSEATLAQGVVFCFIELAPATTLERLVISVNITSAGQVGASVTSL